MGTNRAGLTRLQTVGLVTGGLLAGAVVAGGVGVANAATTTPTPAASSSTATSSGSASTGTATPPQGGVIGGAAAVRSDEKVVTGADAETLTAAALKAVPGGTVVRVETDAGDAAFEVHMTKADGTVVTVKFDKTFAVTGVEDGMGKGDPAPAGAPAAAQPGAPASSSGSSSTTTG